MSMYEIESKIRELRQLQSLIEEAQTEAEAIKDALKAHMGDAEELKAGEYKVTWKSVTSSKLDTAALRKALPDVAERFTKKSTVNSEAILRSINGCRPCGGNPQGRQHFPKRLLTGRRSPVLSIILLTER